MRTAANVVLLVICIITIPHLGLYTTVGLYLGVHMLFLGVRPIVLVGVVTIGTVLVMYGFFGLLLGVQFSGALLI
jgi:hypothetical protein